MPTLTPNGERALLAYLEAALIQDHLPPANPWPTYHSARREPSDARYAPLDFNRRPEMPTLPDWMEYNAVDSFDLYIYN